jgi:hypothetical protein
MIVPPVDAELADFWADEMDEEILADRLVALWLDIRPTVRAKLALSDARMKSKYDERAMLDAMGVEHQFESGDLVLQMQRRIGKLREKAMGPYVFVRYHGPLKLTAEVSDQRSGASHKCSLAHLVPA